jgi:hypothetical protein
LNCTRQWGKSTVTAAMAVHHAMERAGSLTLVVSPSARQSGELLRKAEGFAAKLGMRPKGDGRNQISLTFPNGSRMVGLPGNDATVARVFRGEPAAGGRGVACVRGPVPGGATDAGRERRDDVADEHALGGALFSEDDLRRALRADVEPLGV